MFWKVPAFEFETETFFTAQTDEPIRVQQRPSNRGQDSVGIVWSEWLSFIGSPIYNKAIEGGSLDSSIRAWSSEQLCARRYRLDKIGCLSQLLLFYCAYCASRMLDALAARSVNISKPVGASVNDRKEYTLLLFFVAIKPFMYNKYHINIQNIWILVIFNIFELFLTVAQANTFQNEVLPVTERIFLLQKIKKNARKPNKTRIFFVIMTLVCLHYFF